MENLIGFELRGGKCVFLVLLFTYFPMITNGEELVLRPDFDPPRIFPGDSEYVVNSGNNLTLRCEGKRPITWVLPENLKMDDLKEAASIISVSETPDEEYPHGLLLELFNVSTMDVGYYTCKFNDTDYDSQYTSADLEKLGAAKSIYVYVFDPQSLFVPTEMFISGIQYNSITIPCRPSSPDVMVTLFRDDEEVKVGQPLSILNGRIIMFDRRTGYNLPELDLDDAKYMYNCRYERNGIVDNYIVMLSASPHSTVAPKPNINDSSNGYAVLGGTISLECFVRVELGFLFIFDWTIPNKEAFKENRVIITNTTVKNDGQKLVNEIIVTSTLLVNDVTSKDSGIYKCETKGLTNNKNNAQKVIEVLEKNQSVLNLSELAGQYTLDVKEGQKFAQWNIQIHAYPVPQVSWFDNHHRELSSAGWSDDHSNKYEVITTKTNSQFRINKVTLVDSGIYQLKAVNEYETKTLNLTLIVRAKPKVKVPSENFHIYGSIVGELCTAEGFPLPEIKWNFKPCISDEECVSVKQEPVSEKFYSTKSSAPLKVSSVLSMNATQSGYLTCIGTNSLGSDRATTTFLVTDIEYGFGIFESQGEPLEVTQGDNMSLTCAASLYNYTNDLSWLPNEKSNFSTFKHQSNYSNQITLNIPNIQTTDGGEYVCKAMRILKDGDSFKSETRSVNIQVSEPYSPVISDSNISNKDQNVNLGEQNVEFYCNVDGRPRPTIKWFKDGLEWSPQPDGRISIMDGGSKIAFAFIKDGDEGKYSCEAHNRVGDASKYVNLILKNKFEFKAGYIAIISAIILLFIIMIIYLVWRIGKEKRIRKELSLVGLLNFEEGQTQSLNPELGVDEQAELLPYDRKWEFPREKLKLGKQLGSGAFGVVMKADAFGLFDAEEVTTVAVKMVKKTAEAAYIKALASELKIMVHLGKHLNVVNLLGACTKNVVKRELLVIVEYCRYGNIHNYLLKHRSVYIDQVDHTTGSIDPAMGVVNRAFSVGSKNSGLQPEADYRENLHSAVTAQTTLSSGGVVSTSPHGEDSMNDFGQNSNGSMQPEWRSNYKGDYNYSATQIRPLCTRDLLCWAFQVARGMDYLAQRKVMHGDLAARNILLADDNVVKICDFGLAKSMYKSDNYKKKGDGLLPLKWMAIESIRDRVFSTQSDVWSFGIVLWEMFSLARTPYPGMDADEKLYNKLVEGYRMEKPSYANDEIYEIMLDCWRAKPVQRPSFSELDTKLGGLLEETVRSHYIDLNSPYLEMNNAWLAEKGQDNDYLAMMNAPDYGNIISPNAGRDYVNAPFGGPVTVNIQSPDETDAEGYLCMSPAKNTVFSPHPNKNDVFNFNTPPMQRKTKASQISEGKDNGTELIPMLSKDNKPTRGCSESDGDLPSPLSCKPSSLNDILESSAIANNDNYVNMSNQKSALNNGKVSGNNLDAFSNPSYIIMNSPTEKLADVKQFDNSLYVN